MPEDADGFHITVLAEKIGKIFGVERRLNPAKVLTRIRFIKQDGMVAEPLFTPFDTVQIILNLRSEIDSLHYQLKKGRRLIIERVFYSIKPGSFSIPIRLSDLKEGEYLCYLLTYGPDEKNILKFRLTVPFYYSDDEYNEMVEQLRYIATPEEMKKLKWLKDPRKRREGYDKFWRDKDPTPGTEFNELKEEYLDRVRYAEKNFGMGDLGWRSDRGKIYILYGPPDEIDSHPFEAATRPYEIWYYYDLNLKFIFIDRYGFGRYELLYPEGTRI